MRRSPHRRLIPAALALALLAATTAAGAAAGPSRELPLDPAVLEGRLPNGLRYFVRGNSRPESRAVLWLAVDAGSVLEDDDQRGLAHFVEHMAFNGTRRFAKQEMLDFLESIGMRSGPDVNAYTSFDETVYMLQIPTDDPAVVRKAFRILEDWAGGVRFESAEIDKERGVVLEEWRLGRGGEARLRDRQFPVLFEGSRYAARLPIGDPEVLRGAPHESLRRFYRDWYRPDLLTVIAVGDFDPERIARLIRRHFRRLRGPDEPPTRPTVPVPDPEAPRVSVESDPEVTSSRVTVYRFLPRRPSGTVGDYRRDLVESLGHRMLNRRLDEIRKRPEPPFLSAHSTSGGFVRSRDVHSQSARVAEDGMLRGLEALYREVERVGRHGFTAGELEREKRSTLRAYERAFQEREKQDHAVFASEILRHVLEEEPMPGIAAELDLIREMLPEITLAEVNRAAAGWAGGAPPVVLAGLPRKDGIAEPEPEALLAAIRSAVGDELEPWEDQVREGPLVPVPPARGPVTAETIIPEIGVTEWRLANGARVILKPTDFKNDEILLTGFSPGGHSLVPDDQFLSASLATQILRQGGLGEFSQVELQKALAGKVASATTFLSELEEAVRGGASPDDLETMLSMVYLGFTAPRADPDAFRSWVERMRPVLENRLARPETVFGDRMNEVMTGGHLRRRPLTPEALDRVDLQQALEIHRERFADASDFTFVLVGNLDPDAVRPLVETWLGGLPALRRDESWRDVGVRPPDGAQRVEVRKGIEPKSRVQILFRGPAAWSRESLHDITSLADAVRIRLRDVLREDLGGTYGVAVGGSIEARPRQEYGFGISFGCAPEAVEELLEAAWAELDRAREDGFPAEVLAKVRETQRREREVRLKQNAFWLGALATAYRYDLDPRLVLHHDALVERVTRENLQRSARAYLDPERRVVGVLLPEDAAPDPPTGRPL